MSKKTRTILLVVISLLLVAELAYLGYRALRPDESSLPETDTTKPIATEQEQTLPTAAPAQEPTDAPTEAPTEEAEAPTEGPALYTNPLTGEALDAPRTARIFLASVNNHKEAMPQHGISQADIYYEMLVEGSITRCLGVFTDIASVEKLGAIRSARIYTVGLTQAYDGILAHAGGSEEADKAIRNLGINDIDGVRNSGAGAYYRDQDRRSAGYSLEHTLFTSAEKLLANAEKRDLRLENEKPYDFGLSFAEDAVPDGESAASITLAFGNGKYAKTTTMNFNTDLDCYQAYQFGKDWIDGNTGKPLEFRNVLVLYMKTTVSDKLGHKAINLVGEGDGLFACGGKLIPIKWSHESATAPFVYTLEDGTPLTLGIGHSYIGIVPLDADVSWE